MKKNGKMPNNKDENAIRLTLQPYLESHPSARLDIQRLNDVSVRLRIIDPSFQRKDLVERDNEIWRYLETLPENVFTQITMVLLLTPKELTKSIANLDFENPIPLDI